MAPKQAKDALILARNGWLRESHLETSTGLERLAGTDPRADALTGPYCVNLEYLHHECARLGLCDPVESAKQYIRKTTDYIRDAEELPSTGKLVQAGQYAKQPVMTTDTVKGRTNGRVYHLA